MAGQSDLDKLHQLYVESGRWKCPKAPIDPDNPLHVQARCGAHHWIERDISSGIFICKYCYDVRKYPTSFYAALEATDIAIAKMHRKPRKYRQCNISLSGEPTISPTHGIQKVPMRRNVGRGKQI